MSDGWADVPPTVPRQHVIPIADGAVHVRTPECSCQPLVDGDVVIHHAKDLREKWERQGLGNPGKGWAVLPEDEE